MRRKLDATHGMGFLLFIDTCNEACQHALIQHNHRYFKHLYEQFNIQNGTGLSDM